MTTAQTLTWPHPQHVVDYTRIIGRLHALGVAVDHAPLPTRRLAEWDGDTATLTMREDAPLYLLIAAALEAWNYLTLGPHHSLGRPLLQLVPTPRHPVD